MADEKGISAWMRANSGWLLGVLGFVTTSGVGFSPAKEMWTEWKEGIKKQGYEEARIEYQPQIDELEAHLNKSHLKYSRTKWERDLFLRTITNNGLPDPTAGGVADAATEWVWSGDVSQ